MKTLAASTAIALALSASSVNAQSTHTMGQVCANNLCVYNSSNALVGIPQSDGVLFRQVTAGAHPGWYQMGFTKSGINVDAVLFFTTVNCTGTQYLDGGGNEWLPAFAQYDGLNLWAEAAPSENIVWKSDYYFNPTNEGCQAYCPTGCSSLLVPAGKVETAPGNYHPPFKLE